MKKCLSLLFVGFFGLILFCNHVYAAQNYYLPIFKAQPGYWSGLGMTNLNSTASTGVVVTIYNQNGTVQATETKTIVANGQNNFLIGTSLNSDGWIKVVSDQPLAGLKFLGSYQGAGTDYYIADVPFTNTLSKSLVIPHVAQNDTWDTTVCLANPNPSIATVTLTYTNKSGIASTPYTAYISGNGSKEVTVADIANSTSVKGGFVKVVSTQGLTGFALYNNLKTNNYSYAGINASSVDNIIGSWGEGHFVNYPGITSEYMVLTFYPNGYYIHWSSDTSATSDSEGAEYGTYTHNNGLLNANVMYDGNGDAGLSDGTGIISIPIIVIGDTLSVGDESIFVRVK